MTKTLAEEMMETVKATSKGSNIPAILFKAQVDAKLTHLAQPDKTLALHNAMGMFYDSVGDLIDTFVETYMGLYPIVIVTVGSTTIANPVKYFEDLYSKINTERVSIKESFLQNQIDEIQQLIAHTLYRLKYIQD